MGKYRSELLYSSDLNEVWNLVDSNYLEDQDDVSCVIMNLIKHIQYLHNEVKFLKGA